MSRNEVLDLAYDNLRNVFVSFAHEKNISDETQREILKIFSDAYNDKKAELFMNDKLLTHFQYLTDAVKASLNMYNGDESPKKGDEALEVVYLNHLKKEEEIYE